MSNIKKCLKTYMENKMKNTINGAIYAFLAVSIAFNVALFTGAIGSPQVVKLQDMQVSDVYGGL